MENGGIREMKVYLDDIRNAPEGWTRTYFVDETIEILKSGMVKEISLDNDLGQGYVEGRKVIDYLEEQAHLGNFDVIPERIIIHSCNTVAVDYMMKGRYNIGKIRRERKGK